MKKIIGAIATAAVLSFSGAAYADLMDTTFGNTVTVAGADGVVLVSYQFHDDGTVDMATPGGAVAGTWALTGSNLCVTSMGETSCNDIEDHDVGDSWEATDENGTMTISIVAGH